MKIIITIQDFKVELNDDAKGDTIKYHFKEIKELITSVVEDYKKIKS